MPATDSEEYRAASREGWSASAGAFGNSAPKGASLSFTVKK